MKLIKLFISKCKLDIDYEELRPFFESHSTSPDIFAFQETLNLFGTETILATIPNKFFHDLPKIFVSVIIEDGIKKTVIVEKTALNRIKVFAENASYKTYEKDTYFNIWTGVVLCLKNPKKEPKNKFNLKLDRALIYASIFGIFIFGVENWLSNVHSFIPSILILAGLFLSLRLIPLKYLNSSSNDYPICSLITNGNCNATIGSDKTSILQFSLIDLALIYFSSTLFLSLFFGPAYLKVIFLFSLISLAFILYSIYLQVYILGSWCLYCLGISIILIIKFLYLSFILPKLPDLDILILSKALIIFTCVAAIWKLLKAVLLKEGRLKQEETRLHSILRKINIPEVNFKISKEKLDIKKINHLDTIFIGSSNAKIQLLCILSLDCMGCRELYNDILKMAKKHPNVYGFKILLTVKNNDPSKNEIKVFERLMELNSSKNNVKLTESLDDLFINYLPFHIWLKKWKTSEKNNTNKLEKNKKFLKHNNLKITPLIFFEGLKISYPFNIKDLLYQTLDETS